MGSLEEIGALLGFVAFVGFAVLVFLTFQQARHIRRLRDWAGRAPERAAAELAALEESAHERLAGDPEVKRPAEPAVRTGPGRFELLRESIADRWAEIDRRSPVSLTILLAGFAAMIVGVGIATGGFGLLGGDSGDSAEPTAQSTAPEGEKQKKIEVAVLNGTASAESPGVAGIADRVGEDVKQQGFKLGAIGNAGSFPASVVMYGAGDDKDAAEVAKTLEPLLGTTETQQITPDVEAVADGANVALVIGQDDSGI